MQKNLFLLLTIVLLSVGISCKKKKNDTAAPAPDFQPLTAGSEWNYTITTGATSTSYKLTATSRDTLVNGRSYRVMTNSAGPNEYLNRTGSDYYRFANLAELNNQAVELLYLKDNLNRGQSWVETKNINIVLPPPVGTVPLTAKFTFTVAEKGIDHTVNGTLYRNVIRINAVPEFSALVLGAPSAIPSTSDLRYFYAPGIGLINSVNNISIPLASINNSSETRLTSATIR